MQLGIPGLDFVTESKRFYPGGTEASHVLGGVNIDNQGIAGIEKHMDDESVALLQVAGLARGNELTPVNLSIDLRVQHVLYTELHGRAARAIRPSRPPARSMDVQTGEIIALVSLPDYRSEHSPSAVRGLLRATRTIASTASPRASTNSARPSRPSPWPARSTAARCGITDSSMRAIGVRFGRFTIDDFHGKHRILTLPEVYKYSSNIGTIQIMQQFGKDDFRAFLGRIGIDQPVPIELPEMRQPNVPEQVLRDRRGHRELRPRPVHLAAAHASRDGGVRQRRQHGGAHPVQAQRGRGAQRPTCRSSRRQPARQIRYLMRLNALDSGGSATRMNKLANGYRVGGKTGTAEKVVNGAYLAGESTSTPSPRPSHLDNPRYAHGDHRR